MRPPTRRFSIGRRRGSLPLVAALSLALAAGCGGGSESDGAPTLRTATVERRSVESTVEATGTVEPIKRVAVKSQASGEILEMPVELGDRVQRGDLLVRIDPREEVNELEQARADLEQAEAQLDVAQRRLERAQALRDSGVVTAEELETAILEHANARSAHQRAQTRLELAREQRADATVRAPITGTVIEKQVEEGQIITSTRDVTGGTTLLTMADLREVQVRTLVDESEIGRVKPGMAASITVEAYPDRTFVGEVLKIEPQATVEQNVTMFAVLTRIGNQEGLLRPGMNADVEIVLGRRQDVLALPNPGVKMPDEARRLVEALGLDRSLLEQEPPSAVGGASGAGANGRPAGQGDDGAASPVSRGGGADGQESGAAAREDELPDAEELRSMSREKRRELFESLSPGQRRELRQRMREARETASESGRRTGAPEKAFVFVRDDRGRLTLKPVMVGLSSFEHTEVVAGLAEGDTVVEVPLALVQQRELLERIRRRSGVPGMSRN